MLTSADIATEKQLWLGKRLSINSRGNYQLAGDCGVHRVVVELDSSITGAWRNPHERAVINQHKQIQAAARRKWEAGSAAPVYFSHVNRLQHQLIVLTDADLAGD